MPHLRTRFIEPIVKKKIQYSPVIAIQGARQTGKSFFAREILGKLFPKGIYITFDQDSAKEFASRDIESFMAKYEEGAPLIVDEAQKVPKIFDAVKYTVDKNRIPGKFVLLGSTEFSKLTLIRDSLTGRMTRVRFYPLTLAETLELKVSTLKAPFFLADTCRVSRRALLLHLERGGMPGIFAIRSPNEQKAALQDWIDLTIHRDVHTFAKIKVHSELCLKILLQVAQKDEVSAGSLAKELRTDLRKIKTHLQVLESLFVLQKVAPHSMGTGKPIYYLLDVGIATFLGSPIQKQLETFFLQEYLAKLSFSGESLLERQLYFYRTVHGSRVSFIEESKNAVSAIHIFSEPRLTKKDFYLLSAFTERLKKEYGAEKKVHSIALVSNQNVPAPKGTRTLTWEHIG